MPRLGRRLSDWRIFIDGVEVPHLGFNITFGKNQYAAGQLFLEPDRLVHSFRPNSLIHFFVWDDHETSSDDLDKYKLYAEVELTGPTHTKSPQARSMGVSFAGLFRIFARHRMFMSSVGNQFITPHITGGYAIQEMAAGVEGSGDPFSILALAGEFDPDKAPAEGEASPFRTTKKGTFSDRMLSFIAYLSSYNVSQRLSTVRTRLLNKIASVPDSTIGGMIPATLSNSVFQMLQGEIKADDTFLDLINRFCSQVFYSWYHIPMPFTPKVAPDQKGGAKFLVPDPQTGELVDMPPQPKGGYEPLFVGILGAEKGKIFTLARDYYRNDYVFAPELFYAVPPPCNFIMPEDITDLSYLRNFDAEPTRVILNEPFFTDNAAAYFAPVTLLRDVPDQERLKISAAEFFGTNIQGLSNAEPSKPPSSPYEAPPHTGGRNLGDVSLLSVLDENEIEKGIICRRDFNPFELFTAVAKAFESEEEVSQIFFNEASRADRINEGGATDYEKIMTTIADYRYQLGIAHRETAISCRGLRWIVPGFSAIIFDKDSPYMCFVSSVTFSLDVASGTESTSIQLSNVRTVPSVTKEEKKKLDDRFEKEDKDRREIGRAVVSAIFDKKIEEVSQLRRDFAKAMIKVAEVIRFGQEMSGRRGVKVNPPYDQMARQFEYGSSVVDVPDSLLNTPRQLAARLNVIADPVLQALFSMPRSEAATRFREKYSVPANPAALTGEASEIRTQTFGESNTFGVGGAYTRNYKYTFSQRERYERGDYLQYIKGYLPVFILPQQFDRSVFRISQKDPNVSVESEKFCRLLRAQFERIERALIRFLRFLKEEAAEAYGNNRKPEIDTLGDTRLSEAVQKALPTSDEYIRSFFTALTGFMLPPVWFNKGFYTAKSVDAIYYALLGCQPFYGENTYFGEGLGVDKGTQGIDNRFLYDQYMNFIKSLDRLFPIIDSSSGIGTSRKGKPTEENPDGTTKWQELSEADETSEDPGAWVERHVQRRAATSLRMFLQQHGLKIVSQVSDAPVRETFMVMVPEDAKDENTLFDFIVDEWEMFPNLKTFIGAATADEMLDELLGVTPPGGRVGDPFIKKLRDSVRKSTHPTAKYLFRPERQKLILDYSKRHFGPRAFDGR